MRPLSLLIVFKVTRSAFEIGCCRNHKQMKCTADTAQFYRMVYPDKILEGYHCSKVQKPYWNTIYLDDFPEKELYNMIDFAYDTVLHGFSKKVQKQILEEAGK